MPHLGEITERDLKIITLIVYTSSGECFERKCSRLTARREMQNIASAGYWSETDPPAWHRVEKIEVIE